MKNPTLILLAFIHLILTQQMHAQCEELNQVTITTTTGNWAEEMSWILYDNNNTIIEEFQGIGGFNYTEYTDELCLEYGCYFIEANDSWGDGLLSGGYSLTDAGGQILFQETAPGFGYSVIEPFSKSGSQPAAFEQLNIEEISVYPNPVKDILTINGTYNSVEIYDIYGKLVLSSNTKETINVSSLANGIYSVNINTKNVTTVKKITITK